MGVDHLSDSCFMVGPLTHMMCCGGHFNLNPACCISISNPSRTTLNPSFPFLHLQASLAQEDLLAWVSSLLLPTCNRPRP